MHRNRGFTLIEVLIVVVIIGILSAIAIPNYSEYVTRSRVPEATSGLVNLRVKMEQLFQDCRSYVASANCPLPAVPAANNFGFAIVSTATTYTITATGAGPMSGFSYDVNELNQRSSTMSSPSTWTGNAACWATKKDGSC